MPLISEVIKQVKAQIKVEKTGKTYTRSRTYAKIVCEHNPENLTEMECKYYLMIDRRWIEVSVKEFIDACSIEAEIKILEQLERELKEKVKKELGV